MSMTRMKGKKPLNLSSGSGVVVLLLIHSLKFKTEFVFFAATICWSITVYDNGFGLFFNKAEV